MPAESRSWARAQRRLHWWIAALVLLAFPLGWLMAGVPLSQLLLKFLLYQFHKTLGLLVLAMTLARSLVRLGRGRPGWEEHRPDWQRRTAGTVHALLYALLVTTPVFGYLTAATAPARVPTLFLGVIPVPHLLPPNPAWFPTLRQVHRSLAIALVALATGHALAAVHHHLRGEETLRRMWSGRTTPRPGSPP